MTKNNIVDIAVIRNENWEIWYFERTNVSIKEFINIKTKLILTTAIESKLFEYIEGLDKDRANIIIEWLLLFEDEENIIHCKPFIWNNDLLKYIKYKECTLN